jgi:hypothetical protein
MLRAIAQEAGGAALPAWADFATRDRDAVVAFFAGAQQAV